MSSRARVYAIAGAAAAAAAAIAVTGAVLQARDGERRAGASEPARPPALELGILVRDDAQARELRRAETEYERGEREAARRRFEGVLRRDPSSVEAAVGAAIASWPEGTLARLRDLVERHPESGVARLHLGLALLASGDAGAAEEEWREVQRRDPDSPAAVTAESLLHPRMPPGRPYFVPASEPPPGVARLAPARQLQALRLRAEKEGSASTWVVYGAALQRAGRPVSALEAYDRALAAAPRDVEARAAAAVGRFRKDDPSQAFSRLGPLASSHPRSPVVRFHLGLLLLWLGRVEQAREHLALARDAGAGTVHGDTAGNLLERLDEIRTSNS